MKKSRRMRGYNIAQAMSRVATNEPSIIMTARRRRVDLRGERDRIEEPRPLCQVEGVELSVRQLRSTTLPSPDMHGIRSSGEAAAGNPIRVGEARR